MKTRLPTILVIDDQYGNEADLRDEFCKRLGLIEETTEALNHPEERNASQATASAIFCTAQRKVGELIENSIELAADAVAAGWPSRSGRRWALVLLDLRFDSSRPVPEDEHFGLRILEYLTSLWPDPLVPGNSAIPIVVLSSIERARYSSGANQRGAAEYVEKKALTGEVFRRLLKTHGLIEDSTGRLGGRSPGLLKTLRQARNAASAAIGNLLILGEPGTGKTAIARYLHDNSPRVASPFQALSVSSGMDPQLFKAQLFGYWYGAYTPADKSEAGLAERAHGGTLFVDEIANLPAAAQHELLEYGRLDRRKLRRLNRLGSFPTAPAKAIEQAQASLHGNWDRETQSAFVDVFLIAATNKPIDDVGYRVASGFPEDLFVRLAQEYYPPLVVPSLRERKEDILPLFLGFLAEESKQNGGVWPKALDSEVTLALESYDWPGNIAELAGVARAVEQTSRPWEGVYARHVPPLARGGHAKITPAPTPTGVIRAQEGIRSATGISDAIESLAKAEVRDSRKELEGALVRINAAYGELLERLLLAAFEATRDRSMREKDALLGDLSPTRAISLLFNRSVKTDKAADEIKRLVALLPTVPLPDSDMDRVRKWAVALRGGSKRARSGTREQDKNSKKPDAE